MEEESKLLLKDRFLNSKSEIPLKNKNNFKKNKDIESEMDDNQFHQVLRVIRNLYKELTIKNEKKKKISEISENLFSKSNNRIDEEIKKFIIRYLKLTHINLKKLEYLFAELYETTKYKKIIKIYYLEEFIHFTSEFSQICDINKSLVQHFADSFKDLPIQRENELIITFFNTIFYHQIPPIINYFIISSFDGLEKKLRSHSKYIIYLKRILISYYIITILNKFEKTTVDIKLNINHLKKLTTIFNNKINALNGCLFKKLLYPHNLDKFLYYYFWLELLRARMAFMNQYNDAVIFYLLLCHLVPRIDHDIVKILILIELKWEFKDKNNKFINCDLLKDQFQFDLNNLIGHINFVKYSFYKPKYKLVISDSFCHIIKTNNGTIYTHHIPKSFSETPTKAYISPKKGISPFSGKLCNEENINNLNKKKLNFN